jgi:hypothetical protein
MTMNSGPGPAFGAREAEARLVTVAELVQGYSHTCGMPGPAFANCMRHQGHPSPCAALGTDRDGVPIVVCWWPAGMFPTRPATGEPGD